ncbi:MAG: biotin transporter BioY [Clostridia bacterium]|nr:biotin transporter BioY [Clostridia bacterium]
MRNGRVKQITSGALFCALICVGAFIKIPLPQLPVTMQMFFVLLAGLVLRREISVLAVGTYILLGLAGLPVFASGGGIGYVLMPSFGYMAGFLAAVWVMSFIVERGAGIHILIGAVAVGIGVVYAVGIPYFCIITKYVLHIDLSIDYIIKFCFLAVLPGDILSGAVAVATGKRLINSAVFS